MLYFSKFFDQVSSSPQVQCFGPGWATFTSHTSVIPLHCSVFCSLVTEAPLLLD